MCILQIRRCRFSFPDAMTKPGCKLQDKTRQITLAQGQLLGNLAQSQSPAAKVLPAPVCSHSLPPR